jgi:nicotinamide-nucleotide amidase
LANPRNAAVLAIGSELLDGRTLESNANYICKVLSNCGFHFNYSLQCGDNNNDIIAALHFLIAGGANVIFVTGGLGPTVDDRTRSALAEFSKQELECDNNVVNKLHLWFKKRGRVCAKSNERQAYKPISARWLENNFGTAPGFYLQVTNNTRGAYILSDIENVRKPTGGTSKYARPNNGQSRSSGFDNKTDTSIGGGYIFAMPGIPAEMQPMLTNEVLPVLNKLFEFDEPCEKVFKIFGVPESTLNDLIAAVGLPKDIELIFSVSFPSITVILRASKESAALLAKYEEAVIAAIGTENIFSYDLEDSLPNKVIHILLYQKKTISVAESCTGGLLASLLTAVPGASDCFVGGAITYSNKMKTQLLSVSEDMLRTHGAVSEEVAAAMAEGALKAYNTDYALAITGIAGPAGGTKEKPVGTVCLALASTNNTIKKTIFAPYERERIRIFSAFTVLNMLRQSICGKLD